MKKLLTKIGYSRWATCFSIGVACLATIAFSTVILLLANRNSTSFKDFAAGTVMAASGQVALIILIARNAYIAGRKSCENSNQQKPA